MKASILFFVTACFLTIGSLSRAADAATLGGEVVALKGQATVSQNGQTTRLYKGASVIVGDTLKTGKGARLKLRMIDGAEISLGENTEFIVNEYQLQDSVGRAALELTKGFFRAITGKITKLRDGSFQVRTPVALVGVRGTDFWGEQQANRLRMLMLDGTAIVISNGYGTVEINQPGWGTVIKGEDQAPVPAFQWSADDIKRAAGTVN